MTGMMCGDMKQRVFIIVWTHEYISWWQRCSQLFWMYIDDVINNQWFRGFIITWWQNQNGMKLLLWNYMYKINGKEWGATKRVWFRFVIVLSFFLFFFLLVDCLYRHLFRERAPVLAVQVAWMWVLDDGHLKDFI